MLVLGIDPGIARCGYGLVKREGQRFVCVDYGCIETPAGMDEGERLALVHNQLDFLFKKHEIERVGIEKLFFSKNVTTALRVGQARGVIMLAIQRFGLIPAEFTPNEIKQAVAGYGKANKKQVQQMVKLTLKLAEIPQPDDAADALAIAITTATWMSIK